MALVMINHLNNLAIAWSGWWLKKWFDDSDKFIDEMQQGFMMTRYCWIDFTNDNG